MRYWTSFKTDWYPNKRECSNYRLDVSGLRVASRIETYELRLLTTDLSGIHSEATAHVGILLPPHRRAQENRNSTRAKSGNPA